MRAVTHRLHLRGGGFLFRAKQEGREGRGFLFGANQEGRGGGVLVQGQTRKGGGAYYRYRLLLLLASYFFEAIVQPHEAPNQPSGASCLMVSTLCGALFWVPG